jgi:hypothetical protein
MSQSLAGGIPQTVFVMMPFASDFDDVYAAVKDSIAAVDESFKVVRLDEIRAAGSITDDLIAECVSLPYVSRMLQMQIQT